ncbi:MAG TPA: tetratricopeptide repeat protein [Anaerolineae bacterium]|nr:tetratricopeptide repeat protein [Anaerolineae bacterium]
MDSTLWITLVVLLGGGLISGYLKGRQKDRVLQDFHGYHVTMELVDGRLIWGDMRLHPTGIELVYKSDVQDEHHIETSYILYRDEFQRIQAIYRYLDEINGKQWEKRQREHDRTFHPGLWRRFQRHSRNFVNTVSDSVSQAIGILAGYAQTTPKRRISAGSDAYLSKVSESIIGYVGTKYDPLLERYVGTKVVVEVTEGGTVHEHIGILRDYTADYLEMLDVQYPKQAVLAVEQEEECREAENVRLARLGDSLSVTNIGDSSLLIERLRVGDEATALNAVLDKNDTLQLHVPAGTKESSVAIEAKVVRQLDWILPRAHALIRHKAERYDPDYVFDIGRLVARDRLTAEEERYLGVLRENPNDASSALELGQLLFQRGRLAEAERWLRQAMKNSERLPDGGKLAARQLRYIAQKRTGQGQAA